MKQWAFCPDGFGGPAQRRGQPEEIDGHTADGTAPRRWADHCMDEEYLVQQGNEIAGVLKVKHETVGQGL